MKNSFILYTDNYNCIKDLSNEQKAKLLDAIFIYQIEQKIIQLDPETSMAFKFILESFKRDKIKYEDTLKKRQEAGRLGGITKAERLANVANASNAKQIKQKPPVSDSVSVSVSVSDSVSDNKKEIYTKKKIFVKPSLKEIKDYCTERSNNVSAEKFFDFYESNGWKVGKNAMKNWKAAVRTWEQNNFNNQNNQNKPTKGIWERRELTLEENKKILDEAGIDYSKLGI